MKISLILRQAAGHNLRGITVADAYRFVRYAQADGALTAVESLNVRNALHAWEWLLSTGRLAAAAHAALKALSGAKLAATLDKVLANASEPTVAAYAEQWKEAA